MRASLHRMRAATSSREMTRSPSGSAGRRSGMRASLRRMRAPMPWQGCSRMREARIPPSDGGTHAVAGMRPEAGCARPSTGCGHPCRGRDAPRSGMTASLRGMRAPVRRQGPAQGATRRPLPAGCLLGRCGNANGNGNGNGLVNVNANVNAHVHVEVHAERFRARARRTKTRSSQRVRERTRGGRQARIGAGEWGLTGRHEGYAYLDHEIFLRGHGACSTRRRLGGGGGGGTGGGGRIAVAMLTKMTR